MFINIIFWKKIPKRQGGCPNTTGSVAGRTSTTFLMDSMATSLLNTGYQHICLELIQASKASPIAKMQKCGSRIFNDKCKIKTKNNTP